MTNYPSSLDNGTSLPYPSSTDDLSSPNLAAGQGNQNDAVIAVETKVGYGSSSQTPAAGYLLRSTTNGESTWDLAYPTSATLVGLTDTQTLTNKTIDAANNTITNLSGSDIASGTITATQIANATITATQIANATITLSQMASSALTQPGPYSFTIGTLRVQFAYATVDIAAINTAYSWSVTWPTVFNSVVFGFQTIQGGNSLTMQGGGHYEALSISGMSGYVESTSGTETVLVMCMGIGT